MWTINCCSCWSCVIFSVSSCSSAALSTPAVSVTRSETAVGACAITSALAAKAGAATPQHRAVANKPVHRRCPIRTRLFISANPTGVVLRLRDSHRKILKGVLDNGHVVLIGMDMAVVNLGGSQYGGRAVKVLAARLDEALADAGECEGKEVHIFTLGANMPGDRFTEAQVAKSYLVDRKINEKQVHAVPKGNDTVGSLEAVLKEHAMLIDVPAVLITDPLHTVRARLIAKQLRWTPQDRK